MFCIKDECNFTFNDYFFELRKNNQINIISMKNNFYFKDLSGNHYIMATVKENKNNIVFNNNIVKINIPRLLFLIDLDSAFNMNNNFIKLFCYCSILKNENTIESIHDINEIVKKKFDKDCYIYEYNINSLKNKRHESDFIVPWLFGNVYQNGNICWDDSSLYNINNLFDFKKRSNKKKIDIISQIYLLSGAFFRSEFTHDLERVSIMTLDAFSGKHVIDKIH